MATPLWRSARYTGPLIDLQDVTFRWGADRLFPDTHWTIHSGECWGVIGDYNSERNNLIHALSGDIPPLDGELVYGYESLDPQFGNNPESGIVHLLFEDMHQEMARADSFAQLRFNRNLDQYDEHLVQTFLSVETIDDVWRPEDISPDRRKAHQRIYQHIVPLLGIESLLVRTLDEVSNGERRKLFLARALLADPLLIVMEHPFEGMDKQYRAQLKKVLSHLKDAGLNLMFVAPDLASLPSMVTHVARVDSGSRIKTGKRTAPRRATSALAPKRTRLPSSWRSRLKPGRLKKPVVSMENVSIAYDGHEILRNINWTVQPGECWSVAGSNGAGKTTLLSLLQGDHPQAYANRVEMFGKPYGPGQSIWEVKKRIGAVSPETHLYFPGDANVLDVVCTGFSGTIKLPDGCGPVRCGIAMDWLTCLGLQDRADQSFADLPEEEQRMVLIARAVVKPLDLLILDEPCMGLDAPHRARFLAIVEQIVAASGCALIYVTHDPRNLPDCITHHLRLKNGRVTRRSAAK